MATKIYGSERRGGLVRGVFLVLLALFVLLLLYLFLPFGTDGGDLRSDARAGEASPRTPSWSPGPADCSPCHAIAGGGSGRGAGQDQRGVCDRRAGVAVETLEGLTELPIGKYVVLNFGGVEEIVNALGGITIDVEEPIDRSRTASSSRSRPELRS